MSAAYDVNYATQEYEEAKGKMERLMERLRNLRISLTAEEWESEREKKKWIAEKEQLEPGNLCSLFDLHS